MPAIATLQGLLAADPAHEEAHACLMRLYALSGQRRQALRQYQALQTALRQELEAAPDSQSQQLYESILSGRFPHTAAAPALPAEATYPNNLPIPLTNFIGREREIAEIQWLLATTRLLTLAGPGGCGKTRLALEAAAALLPAYPDGAWLVELAALADPALVPQAVAAALGVRETPGWPLAETLVAYLKPRQLLLVLDNCEHVIEACAQFTEAMVRVGPSLRMLATSRESLHLSGEVIWLVPSLALPDLHQLPPLNDLIRYEAIRLFRDRAVAVQPSFHITDQYVAAVAQVCCRLDGIPLAIELAAARVKVLAVEQIVGRLDDCFRLLTSGSRTVLTRQRTLKATLDWSYDLLLEPERVLFLRLAVFVGGFGLETVEAICAGDGIAGSAILDLLTQLVDKSQVVAEPE